MIISIVCVGMTTIPGASLAFGITTGVFDRCRNSNKRGEMATVAEIMGLPTC